MKNKEVMLPGGSVCCIDVPFILLSQESINEYYKDIGGAKKLKLEKISSESMKFNQDALTFFKHAKMPIFKLSLWRADRIGSYNKSSRKT